MFSPWGDLKFYGGETHRTFPSIATKVAAPEKVVAQHIFLMLTYNYNKPFGFEDKVEKLAAH